MEFFELSTKFSDVWNTLFFPLIQFVFVVLTVYFIVGKEPHYKNRNKIIEHGGMLFRKRKGLYCPIIPLQERIHKLMKSNAIISSLVLLISIFTIRKAIYLVAYFFPITYYYVPTNLLLFTVDETIIASIWSYCPEIPFSELPYQINRLSQTNGIEHFNESLPVFVEINSLCTFLLILSVILIFLPKPIKRVKRLRRALLVIIITMITMGIMHVYDFSNTIHVTEQKCINVLQQYQLENPGKPSDNPEYLNCFTRLEDEKRLSEIRGYTAIFGFTFKNNIDDLGKLFLVITKLSFH